LDQVAQTAVTGLDDPDKQMIRRVLAVVRDNLAHYVRDVEQ
jgi:hypothetical protein